MTEPAENAKPLPAVSIIIPHLNQAVSLRKCLEALSNHLPQKYNVEILVVDNGSSDLPMAIVADFPGVRLLEEAELGPGPARNRGIAESHGKILLFVDADCRAGANWIEVAADILAGEGAPQIIGGDVRIDVRDPGNLTVLEAYETVFAFRQQDYIEQKQFSGAGNLGTTRAVFEAVGPFEGVDVAEDRVWGRKASSLGHKTVYVPEMVVYHPSRSGFDVIFAKWARHTSHDFNEGRHLPWFRVRWALKALALAASIPVHSFRVIRSKRLNGIAPRMKGILGLARVRWYRVRLMARYLVNPVAQQDKMHWNK